MASVMAKDLHELLLCDICCEQMQDPLVLDCQHTFCQKCLLQWQHRQADNKIIPCPTCRVNTPLASGSFVGLKKDRRQEELAGVVKQLEEPYCEVCSGSAQKPKPEKASSFCRNCQDCMCCKCAKAHMKFPLFKDHELLPIREFKNNDEFCQEHPLKSKDFYCEECDDLICSLCTTKKHHEHIHLVHSAADYCKAYVKQVKRLVSRADKCQQTLQQYQESKKNISTARVEVKEHVKSIIKGIKMQEAKILVSLHAKSTKLKTSQGWVEKNNTLKPLAEQLSKKYRTYLRTRKPADLLIGTKDLYKNVDQRLEKCGKDFPTIEGPVNFVSGPRQHFSIGKVEAASDSSESDDTDDSESEDTDSSESDDTDDSESDKTGFEESDSEDCSPPVKKQKCASTKGMLRSTKKRVP